MARVYGNKKLIYLGVILCFFFSSIGCIIPFLTLHMRQLGFTLPEISTINTVSAFVSLLGPIIGGVFAERNSKHKLISVICILTAAFAYTGITFISRYDKLLYHPLVDFSCTTGIRIERCVNWNTCGDAFSSFDNLTTIQLTSCTYRCPAYIHMNVSHPLHICLHSDDGNICVVSESNSDGRTRTSFETRLSSWKYVDNLNEDTLELNGSLALFEDDDYESERKGDITQNEAAESEVSMCNYHPSGSILFNKRRFHSISCRPEVDECDVRCQTNLSFRGMSVFPRSCEKSAGNPVSTFWSYLFLRCIGDLCLLTSICLLDSLMISVTSDYDGAYGRVQMLPALGMTIFSPLSGFLLDQFTDMEGEMNFRHPAFLFSGFAVLTCALIIALPIVPKKNFLQFHYLPDSIQTTFFSVEMVALLIIVFILGIQWSILYTFLPWMAHDVGCSGMQTGLAFSAAFGFSLPFLLISKNMVRNIGRANLLVFAFLFYGTRYAGVSFVLFPWWTMPFAAMETFTLCVMWMSAVAYGQYLSPPGYHLVMQYTLNALHFGIGRGFGSLLGGVFISHYGLRQTFRGVAVWSSIVGFLYLGLYHCIIRRKRSSRIPGFPVLLNRSCYPMRQRQSNGDTKAHQPIVGDQDDDTEIRAPPSTVKRATSTKK